MKPPKPHKRTVLSYILWGIAGAYFVSATALYIHAYTPDLDWQLHAYWAILLVMGGAFILAAAALVDGVSHVASRADEMAQMLYELRGGPVTIEPEPEPAAAPAESQPATNAPVIDPGDVKFFYMVKDEIFGPFRFRELLALKSNGEINDATLVQEEDEDKWVELGSLVSATAS